MSAHGESDKTREFRDALEQLAKLRRFTGAPAVFWQSYLDALVAIGNARFGLIVRKKKGDGSAWRKVIASPANADGKGLSSFFTKVEDLCEAALEDGESVREISPHEDGSWDSGVAVRLDTGRIAEQWVAVFLLSGVSPDQMDEAVKRLLLANCMPGDVQNFQIKNQNAGAAEDAKSVIDLVVMLDGKTRFLEMAMSFVNELAGQHRCERVTLGWIKRGYVRLQAISHSDKFERKMEVVNDLEKVMEEAFDQDEEIYFPPLDEETIITRDHARFSSSQGVKYICSIPLRVDDEPQGVVTLERSGESFVDDDIRLLRVTADLAAPRLADLRVRDRWFGARLASGCRRLLAKVVGPEKTWSKVMAAVGAIGLFVLLFGGMNYRVEAPFLLRTESVSFISTPYDGYISEVHAEVGDIFKSGDQLLSLDTRELLLEEAAASADLTRFLREEEKARAVNELAEMRISSARAEQARVQLDATQFRLSQAVIKSPFDAFVVEGDLKKRLGAPVKQGDVLFKIARLDQLYIEAKVDERDIHEIEVGAEMEIAFTSQPKHKFPATVILVEPVATTEQNENVFLIRARLDTAPEEWWRPGMGGISKVNSGRRTFFWIIFHRTIDFLRMFFWL
ncbi:MAG: HlyD family efflux transporter periplasmic adaptor subunit [Puniceicoccaceae bacterium]